MTYGELKLITMQKCKVAEGNTIPDDETTQDYLAQLPFSANECLAQIATAGKYVVRALNINQNFVPNLLNDDVAYTPRNLSGGSTEYKSAKGRSYIFDYSGQGTLVVSVDGVAGAPITLIKATNGTCRGFIDNEDGKEVTLTVSSDYPFSIRNVAVYDAIWESKEEIDPCKKFIRYNLKEIAPDFYQVNDNQVYFEGVSLSYVQTTEYFQEGDKVLVLDRKLVGEFTIYYRAYPVQITDDMDDDDDLDIDTEVSAILPLYCASQILKGDEDALATQYRNEYEVAFSRLSVSNGDSMSARFTSESGW